MLVDHGLIALKTSHVQWASKALKCVHEKTFISDSFRQVDYNLAGYTHCVDRWIKNEYKNNTFKLMLNGI